MDQHTFKSVLLFISIWLIQCCVSAKSLSSKHQSRQENEVIKPEVEAPFPYTAAVPPHAVEAFYYGVYGDVVNELVDTEVRDGQASTNHTCMQVRSVPEQLRSSTIMRPYGISNFYQKYTEAYDIPILGSGAVPDRALQRACYVLRFMLADRQDVRQKFYESYGRVVIIAAGEKLTDIPEYIFLSDIFDVDTPGLGGVPLAPASSAMVENVMCMSNDTWKDDVLIRMLAHGIHHLAAKKVIPTFQSELEAIYQQAMDSGWWQDTYAAYSPDAYFGEGVQSFFNVNAYSSKPDGMHNDVDTRTKLASYDTDLYRFILQLFGCGNNYMKRCNSRHNEAYVDIDMNCPIYPFVQG